MINQHQHACLHSRPLPTFLLVVLTRLHVVQLTTAPSCDGLIDACNDECCSMRYPPCTPYFHTIELGMATLHHRTHAIVDVLHTRILGYLHNASRVVNSRAHRAWMGVTESERKEFRAGRDRGRAFENRHGNN